MAVKKPGMGSVDSGRNVPYNPPNPPKTKIGSAGSGSRPKPAPVQPPRTPIQKQDARGVPERDMPYIGPFKKGGRVKKTGVALVHKGEHVIAAKGRAKKTGKRTTSKH